MELWKEPAEIFFSMPLSLTICVNSWTMLGVALSAYQVWLDDESVSLLQALGDSFDTVSAGLKALDNRTGRRNS